MGEASSLISLKGITKTYRMGELDVPVLKGVDLDIEAGDHVVLVGSSGSGKSTLMNIIGCLDRPTAGVYTLDSEDMSSMNRDDRARVRGHKIGFIFQNFNLLPRTPAIRNVELPLLYGHDVSARERHERARAALERVGLGDRMDHHSSQLSGGQQQRVAIARALITRPRILLADEPTGNLDSASGNDILGVLDALNAEGVTLIVVTHDADVADRGRRVIRMQDGVILEEVRKAAAV